MGKTFTTKDGAQIYYEAVGNGQPLVLVHGWICSSKFWRNNVPELSKNFQVITMDMRGHGNSSKILTGHTIPEYARDVRQLIEHLGLADVSLFGWSLAGQVVLSYWQQYCDDSRLKALGLVDINPAPFSQETWNCHMLKESTFDGMNALNNFQATDAKGFAGVFAGKFTETKPSAEEFEWMVAELLKTPSWIATAIHSDFLIRDYTPVLPTITLPTIVFAADSHVSPKGIALGRFLADQIPDARLVPFDAGGHLLFYDQAAKFNQVTTDFIREIG
jgi:non-heme chloroperoxidase